MCTEKLKGIEPPSGFSLGVESLTTTLLTPWLEILAIFLSSKRLLKKYLKILVPYLTLHYFNLPIFQQVILFNIFDYVRLVLVRSCQG